MDSLRLSSSPPCRIVSAPLSSTADMRRRMVVVFRRRVNRGFLVAYPSACRWTTLLAFEAEDGDDSSILFGFPIQTFSLYLYCTLTHGDSKWDRLLWQGQKPNLNFRHNLFFMSFWRLSFLVSVWHQRRGKSKISSADEIQRFLSHECNHEPNKN